MGQPAPAAVTHLSLTHFRNYRHVSLDPEAGIVVLTGPNGGGKTNLLEAISLFAPGGGLRQAKLADIDLRLPGNVGQMAWAAHAKVATPSGEFALGTGRDPVGPAQTGRDRRLNRINGAPAKSQSAFAEILAVQWVTPQMDRLFDDAASARRRFLDRLVFGVDPGHAGRVASYETAMRERARLLRGEGPATGQDLSVWLDGLEAEMAGLAIAVAAARQDAVARLNDALAEAEGPFPRASLACRGAVEAWLLEGSALAAEEKLKACLHEARADDAAQGMTHWGTHRSDLEVLHHGRSLGNAPLAAAECSTGEQRALLLSIAFAEARLTRRIKGQAPVMLLDETVAHLDPERRLAFFETLMGLGVQAWLTGVERELFKPLRNVAQFFTIESGHVASNGG